MRKALKWLVRTSFALFPVVVFGSQVPDASVFVENAGQWPAQYKYRLRADSYTAFVSSSGIIFGTHGEQPTTLAMSFSGGGEGAFEPGQETSTRLNFLRAGAKASARSFNEIRQRSVYEGVDVRYYSRDRKLQYDFIVSPYSEPGAVEILFDDGVELTIEDGDLLVSSAGKTLRHLAPVTYQIVDGERAEVQSAFEVRGQQVRFSVGDYNENLELIIDPVVDYSTFLGGGSDDRGLDVTVDSQGATYVVGSAMSIDFPTLNSMHPVLDNVEDTFVAKFSPDGQTLEFVTFIGGGLDGAAMEEAETDGRGIALGVDGSIFIAGATSSATSFPLVDAMQPTYGGGPSDGYVARLTADGSALLYATYIGGLEKDRAIALAVDEFNAATVVGMTKSPQFPTTSDALQPMIGADEKDGFVAMLAADGSLLYSTFLGGDKSERINAVVADGEGSIYLAGMTKSKSTFPGVVDQTLTGNDKDVFVTKLGADSQTIEYTQLLGGSLDEVALDVGIVNGDTAVVTGWTESDADFPVTDDAHQPTFAGGSADGFVAWISDDGEGVLYASFLGSTGKDKVHDLAVNESAETGVSRTLDFEEFTSSEHGDRFGEDRDVLFEGINFNYRNADKRAEWGSWTIVDVTSEVPGAGNSDNWLKARASENGKGAKITRQRGFIFESMALFTDLSRNSFVESVDVVYRLLDGTTSVGQTVVLADGTWNTVTANDLGIEGQILRSLWFVVPGTAEPNAGKFGLDDLSYSTPPLDIWLTGETDAADFPSVHALQDHADKRDAFVSQIALGDGSIVFSTHIGGLENDKGKSVALGSSGDIVLTGFTRSDDFPVSNAVQSTFAGDRDAFVTRIQAANTGPSISSSAPTEATVGELYVYQVMATDPNPGDILSYALATAPDGMTIDGGGLIQFLPDTAGMFMVSIEVSDGNGGMAEQTFTLHVSQSDVDPPVISVLSPTDGTVTNQSEITATGFVNEEVTLEVDGVATPVDPDLSFSSAAITLDEGVNMIVLSATDLAGNTSVEMLHVTRDSVAPIISIFAPVDGLETNVPNQIVSGTVSEAAVLTLDGVPVSVDTDLSFAVSVDLVEGQNVLEFEALDEANNTGSASLSLTLDTVAPTITVSAPQDGSVTNQVSLLVTGSLSEIAFLEVAGVATDVQSDLSFVSAPISLVEGENAIIISASDAAGNLASRTVDVTLDTVAPVITIDSPSDGSVTNQGAVAVFGFLDEEAVLTIEGVPVEIGADLSFTSQSLNLVEGLNVISMVATDTAGNESTASLNVSLDTIPPELIILSPADGQLTNQSIVSVSGSAIGAVSVLVNGQPAVLEADGSFMGQAALSEGANVLDISALDLAGNVSVVQRGVTLDSSPPAINAALITRSAPSGGVVMVNGDPGAVEPGALIVLTNSRTGFMAPGVVTSTGSFVIDVAAFGNDVIELVASDQAGNATAPILLNPPQASSLTLNPIGDRTAPLGRLTSFVVSANDSEGATIRLDVLPRLPEGSTFHSLTGEFRYAPSPDQVGDTALTFVAETETERLEETITLTVTSAGTSTSFTSRLLDANALAAGQLVPIVGATVTFLNSGVVTTSDEAGFFTLSNLPEGAEVIDIQSQTAQPGPNGEIYSSFREKLHLIQGVENRIERPISLPQIAVSSLATVDPSTTTISVNEEIGVVLTVPPGSAVLEDGSFFTGQVSVSLVPKGFEPVVMPDDLDPGLLLTVQPVGVRFLTPAPLSFPNIGSMPQEAEVELFSLNPDTGVFESVGINRVSEDGDRLETVEGGVRQADWHYVDCGTQDPKIDINPDNHCNNSNLCLGSTANPANGSLRTDFELPNYRSLEADRGVRFIYESRRATPNLVLPVSSSLDRFQATPTVIEMNMSLEGLISGSAIINAGDLVRPLVRPQGSPKPFNLGVNFAEANLPTGNYKANLSLISYYPGFTGSMCVERLGPLTCLRTATVMIPGSRWPAFSNTSVLVENESESPFGAGWMLEGLTRLVIDDRDGEVLRVSPRGDMITFRLDPEPEEGEDPGYLPPDGEFSTLVRLADGSFVHATTTGVISRYQGDGRLVSRSDRVGNTTTYTYTGSGNLQSIIDPEGLATTFAYDVNDRLASITDPASRVTTFEIDPRGDLTSVTFPDGTQKHFTYEDHLMSMQTNERNHTTAYEYDAAGLVTTATLPDDTVRRIGSQNGARVFKLESLSDEVRVALDNLLSPGPLDYSVLHTLATPRTDVLPEASFTDGRGNESELALDRLGNVSQKIDEIGRVTSIERDVDGLPQRTTRPNGSVVERTFDGDGNVLSTKELFNSATTSFTYDDFSLVTSMTNPRSHTTTILRDPVGNPEQIINQLGHTTMMEYDVRGLVERMVEPNGLETLYTYTPEGLLETTTEIPPVGSPGTTRVTLRTYDDAGLLETLTTPDGITLAFTYDLRGRVLTVTDNLSQQIAFAYDDFGNIETTETRNSDGSLALIVASTFDSRNRLVETASPHDGTIYSVVQLVPDANDNIEAVIDPKLQTSSNLYDAANRLKESTHRLNGVTKFEYDDLDRVTSVTAPNGAVTIYTYDDIGRRLTEESPDRGLLTYGYDKANNLTSITDARGVIMTMGYDGLERLTSKTFANSISGKDESVSYVYDTCPFGIGRLCERHDEAGVTTFEYDAFGNVITKTRTELGVTYTQTYGYDGGDNVVSMTLPSGRTVDISRDGVRRVGAIDTTVGGAARNVLSNVTYRADNQITGRTFGNGLVDARTYDLQGRLASQTVMQGGSVLDARDYAFDVNSNIEAIDTNVEDNLYTYDALDRLTGDQNDAIPAHLLTYDLNDNRLTRGPVDPMATGAETDILAYEAGTNRLTSVDTLTETATVSFLDRELVYNDAGRLFKVIDDGLLKSEYVYNDFGQRTRKTVYATDGTPTTTLYHYDLNGHLIAETTDTGATLREYIWQENLRPLAQIDVVGGSERITYLHTDHLMTARLATDQSGAVIWRWEGEAFGATQATELDTVSVNLRFPGQYFDEETSLHYNHFRYYDPSVGRYITSDPLGFSDGLNGFVYVGGNPTKFLDLQALAKELKRPTTTQKILAGLMALVTGETPPEKAGEKIKDPNSFNERKIEDVDKELDRKRKKLDRLLKKSKRTGKIIVRAGRAFSISDLAEPIARRVLEDMCASGDASSCMILVEKYSDDILCI